MLSAARMIKVDYVALERETTKRFLRIWRLASFPTESRILRRKALVYLNDVHV